MAKSIDVCEIYGCTEVPQKGETICSSCWNRHDNSDLPGFPSEYDSSDCECGECLACVEEERAWYVRFEAGEFELKNVSDQKCRRAFISEVPCDKDGTFHDDCCKTHWVELNALQAPIRERSYNERKDAWSVD